MAFLAQARCLTPALYLMWLAMNSFQTFGQDNKSSETTLASLIEQRRDVLAQRVEVLEALVGSARGTPEDLIAARDDLLAAEYESATSKAQRIDVLQRKLANAKQYELVMEQRKNDARGSQADVLMATARRLGVKIELLREQP